MRNNKGQILVFVALFMMTLVMLFLLMLNVGMTVKERIRMQNAVDSAAQSAALWHARGLNLEAHLNTTQDVLLGSTAGAVLMGQFALASKLYNTSCRVSTVQEKIAKYFPYIAMYSAYSIGRKNGADWVVPININMSKNLGVRKSSIIEKLFAKIPKPDFFVPGKDAFTVYDLDDDKYWFPQEEKGIYLTFLAHKKNTGLLGTGLLGSGGVKIYTIATARPRFEKGELKPGRVNAGWGASLMPVRLPGDPSGRFSSKFIYH